MSNHTFVIAVISPDQRIQQQIAAVFDDCPQAGELWSITDYPAPDQLTPFRESAGASVVYLDFSNTIRAKGVAYEIDRWCPNTVVIAILPAAKTVAAEEMLELGVRAVLPSPPDGAGIMTAFQRAVRKLDHHKEADRGGNPLYAFVPVRPGCGATTLAAYTAAAVGRLSQQPTLLIDLDLRYGLTSFLFQLHADHSVLDALACSNNLDSMWDHIVCNRGALDILGSASADTENEIPAAGITNVLDFARLRYRTVCVDLAGELRGHELPALKTAKEIFLVCTPELGALHLARRKSEILQSLGHGSRTTVILNRAHGRSAMSIGDIEEILQLPVRFTVPNAEREVTQATVQAVPLEGRSAVARQIEAVARHMMPVPDTASFKVKARRFLETFSVTPAREKAGWWR